ncbi:ATP-binding cassette domain-containing protein [Lactococcus garvieae]|uniref:ATP-binding cassette domain-containing protein n=1 Tax=Lactococcus garvieae TaxID=1363 RepID=UPI0018D90CA1|nr:ATP-binding cassette domain-containing protein [Lactococcus garvieae]QPS71961.1 ATP-binding cassette domain-containing protein [Lactococcus garvieae]
MKVSKIKAQFLSKKFEMLPVKSSLNKAKSLISTNEKEKKDFWALRNVSFEIHEGECVGVIGLNGAGKSTLSNIISGQIAQTTGQVEINGDVSIIAAHAGLQNNLSGRENIRLKALMVGMKNKEIKAKMDEIIAFSELGPFIDQPVKTYSSGMKAKLGFSIMVHQDPDIMIIDEGLSVGDKTFVDKSQKKMFEFRDKGKTILLVSHDMRTIKEWCDRVIWLNYGEVKQYGKPEEVLPEYEKFVRWFKGLSKKEQENYKQEQRQAQFNYSVESLRKEIISQNPSRSRRVTREVTEVLRNKKDNHKLSFISKIVLGCCAFVFIWITLVSLSNTTLRESIAHPVELFTQHLFKAKHSSVENRNSKQHSKEEMTTSSSVPSSSISENATNQSNSEVHSSSETTASSSSIPQTTYEVQAGESLGSIAESKGLTVEEIQTANPDIDFNIIQPGQTINLPVSGEFTTAQTGEGVIQ